MTKLVGRTLIIQNEQEGKCELCGKIAELRPYGPNGERICIECGKKNMETTEKKFRELLNKSDQIIDFTKNN